MAGEAAMGLLGLGISGGGMAGFGGGERADPYAALSSSIITAAQIQAGAATQAAQISRDIADQNIAFLKEQANIARSDLAPFREAGMQGMGQLQDLLGFNGKDAEQAAVSTILQSPRTQSALKLGLEAIDRSAAAKGMTQSGRVLEQLHTYGQDLAATRIGDTQNALLQLASIGQNAAAGSASVAQQLGQNVSGENRYAGEQQSNAVLAAAQAQANAVSTIGQLNFQKLTSGAGSPLGYGGTNQYWGGGMVSGGLSFL